MQESLATLVLITSFIAWCTFVLIGYRASSRGTYNKRAVAAFTLAVLILIGMRMLVECMWSDKCSLHGLLPKFEASWIDNGWVEFLAITVSLGMMIVYVWLVAAGYGLLPIFAASLAGMVVGRMIWSLRQRPLPHDNDGKPISSLNNTIEKLPFGRKSK